jgi:surface polysaccharide O-acyltransferase-like enzyme
MQDVAAKPRYGWIDLAKALSILLVVLNHELIYFRATEWSAGSFAALVWSAASDTAAPVRMPLFFLASGFLAASSLDRERSVAFRKRVFRLFYVYAIWAALFLLLIPAWPAFGASNLSTTTLILQAIAGYSPAWYLWALPAAFLIGAAAVVAVLPLEFGYSGNLLRYLVYFLIGLRVRGLADMIGARVEVRQFMAGSIVFGAMLALDLGAWNVARPLVELTGVATAAMGCVLLARTSPRSARAGQWLAQRTLPIYLLQFPLLAAMAVAAPRILPASLTENAAFAFAYPLLATALVVVCSLAFYAVRKPLRMSWLFDLPRAPPASIARPSAPSSPSKSPA